MPLRDLQHIGLMLDGFHVERFGWGRFELSTGYPNVFNRLSACFQPVISPFINRVINRG
jgi:hypothetical protein